MSIGQLDRNALEDLLSIGEYKGEIEVGKYKIVFNLASIGDEANMEVHSLKITGGIHNDKIFKCCVLAQSILRIGGYDFANESTEIKIKELGKLQENVINFLWDAYQGFRIEQSNLFNEYIESGKLKKSSPSQDSEQPGNSGNSLDT